MAFIHSKMMECAFYFKNMVFEVNIIFKYKV